LKETSGHVTGTGGLKLFYRTWEPEHPSGSLVLVHGMNEHTGRYEHVARFFAGQGLAIYGMDQRGYGQSEGTRCYSDRFTDYLEDMRLIVDKASQHGKPIMIGHSFGGLVAFQYGLAYPESLKAVVVSSPGFGAKAKPNLALEMVARVASRLAPKMQFKVTFPPESVCRDPQVVAAYAKDPYGWYSATPRWYTEMTAAGLACRTALAAGMKLPVLFLQAGDDLIVDPDATRAVYQQVPHDRKAFKLYPGKYHEVFNDPGHDDVFADILAWLKEQELLDTL